jgi:ATP phosphoribosyltransferase regulatory subunit
MPGRTPDERLAIERIERAVMTVFESAGFAHIAPDILQPADIFLERSGEDIRSRTYVFTDPGGSEMCLRPDLTVPACRYHLSHAARPEAEARYCYCGPAFRYPNETASPGEFGQAGIEWYAAPEREAAEARVLKLTLNALETAGVTRPKVTLGDLGLFQALLADTPMPERWRRRLRRHFWRPRAFHDLLEQFAAPQARKRTSISGFVDLVAGKSLAAAVASLEDIGEEGGRSVEEIAERLLEKAADRNEAPIAREHVERINAYLGIAGEPLAVTPALARLGGGEAFAAAVEAFGQRLEEMEELGLNPRRFRFAATFGRNLEYYTGFVFQIEAGQHQIAGGGRYDELLSDMGSPVPVPAVGCGIHINRVLAVIGGPA